VEHDQVDLCSLQFFILMCRSRDGVDSDHPSHLEFIACGYSNLGEEVHRLINTRAQVALPIVLLVI